MNLKSSNGLIWFLFAVIYEDCYTKLLLFENRCACMLNLNKIIPFYRLNKLMLLLVQFGILVTFLCLYALFLNNL